MKLFFLTSLLILTSACSMVGPRERGVRITSGEATKVVEPGMYFSLPPFIYYTKIDVSINKVDVQSSAATKDMQELNASLTINWQMPIEELLKTYSTVGDNDMAVTNIIIPAMNEVLKASTATKTAEEILAKRIELKEQIDTLIKNRVSVYGLKILDVSITNVKFTGEFEKAIEAKQIAEQQAKQALFLKDRTKAEAEARIEQAKGEAMAQKLLQASLTEDLLRLKAIEKWNGQLPQVTSGSVPLINIAK